LHGPGQPGGGAVKDFRSLSPLLGVFNGRRAGYIARGWLDRSIAGSLLDFTPGSAGRFVFSGFCF
jgi:hypothetical protein